MEMLVRVEEPGEVAIRVFGISVPPPWCPRNPIYAVLSPSLSHRNSLYRSRGFNSIFGSYPQFITLPPDS